MQSLNQWTITLDFRFSQTKHLTAECLVLGLSPVWARCDTFIIYALPPMLLAPVLYNYHIKRQMARRSDKFISSQWLINKLTWSFSACPPSSMQHGNRCYCAPSERYIYKNDASAVCEQFTWLEDGMIARLRNHQVKDFLSTVLLAYLWVSHMYAW